MISFNAYIQLDEETRNELLTEAKKTSGRFKRVNRIRGGKIQRRKVVATKKGFTVRGGKIIRMKATERIRRRLAQKRGARKRRAKKSQMLRNRKRSLRRAKALGFIKKPKRK